MYRRLKSKSFPDSGTKVHSTKFEFRCAVPMDQGGLRRRLGAREGKMTSAFANVGWHEAMAVLQELLSVEDPERGAEIASWGKSSEKGREGAAVAENYRRKGSSTVEEALRHWAELYVRYIGVLRSLEKCYDAMVHPQKRIDAKMVLELVMTRILQLKANLIKWYPAHASLVAPGCSSPLPWQYVNFDELLAELKLPPSALDIPIPSYFLEDHAEEHAARDSLVNAMRNLDLDKVEIQHGESEFGETDNDTDSDEEFGPSLVDLTLEEAVITLQTFERGRQARSQAEKLRQMTDEDEGFGASFKPHLVADADELGGDRNQAATNIQRMFRGRSSRMQAQEEKDEELVFLGMKRPTNLTDIDRTKMLESKHAEIEDSKERKKAEQRENRENYSKALIKLHGTVLEEEGPEMRESMMDERREWFTSQLAEGVFPEDLTEFYLNKYPTPESKEREGAAKGKGAKRKPEAKKDTKKKGEMEEQVEKVPPLTASTPFSEALADCLRRYKEIWLDRDESQNSHQKHDVGLAKNVVRPNVEEEVRENVDRTLITQLNNLKLQLEAAAGKKGKKKPKKGGKKKKGKSGKKKKGRKAKALPGDKFCADMDVEEMVSTLVRHGFIKDVSGLRKIGDYVGEFNFLGTAYQNESETQDAYGNWVPQDPCASQVRSALTEQLILPLGSEFLRISSPFLKSMLLYGPRGAGKTMLTEAVAAHTNALFIELTPETLQELPSELCEGKSGPLRLIHIIFSVARHPSFQPGVIAIKDIDRFFVGKKKSGSGNAHRFKKDLITYANSLKPEERVAIIGCSHKPFNIPDTEIKDLKILLHGHLHVPYPDYASRIGFWRTFLEQAFNDVELEVPKDMDCSVLASLSEGYTAGSIKAAIDRTLTERRKSQLRSRPLSQDELVKSLSTLEPTYSEDNRLFQKFTAQITGLQQRRELAAKAKASNTEDNSKKKKK